MATSEETVLLDPSNQIAKRLEENQISQNKD